MIEFITAQKIKVGQLVQLLFFLRSGTVFHFFIYCFLQKKYVKTYNIRKTRSINTFMIDAEYSVTSSPA